MFNYGILGVPKIFKMPPKIVIILVLGTPEYLELGLMLPENRFFWVVFWIFLLTGKSDWALVFLIGLVPFSHKFW